MTNELDDLIRQAAEAEEHFTPDELEAYIAARFWLVKIDDHYGQNPRGPYPNQNQARLLAEEDEKLVTTQQLGIMRQRRSQHDPR